MEPTSGLEVGETVAVKLLHVHLLGGRRSRDRFLREGEMGASIRHENVVRTLSSEQLEVDGQDHLVLVMELIEGQNLRELLNELGELPEELCRHIACEVARGLSAIHDAGIVHRDLKPENIVITPAHTIKIMDLGIAKSQDDELQLSRPGAFVGSVMYAAPEQFRGGTVDSRSDLHALGVLLYELSSGAHPYRTLRSDGIHEVMHRICEEPPRRLGEVRPQLSAFFEEVVHTLMAKSRENRFAGARELLEVLVGGEDSDWWFEHARALQEANRRPIRRVSIPRETAVYGREQELSRLVSLFRIARDGKGRVVLLEGEAGIGKSRLIDELVARLRLAGEDINFLYGGYPPGGAATSRGAFSTAFREQLGSAGSAPYLVETPALSPAFDALLNGHTTPTGQELLNRDSVQTCFISVMRGLAAERTTVIMIDDLHFAASEGLALFATLAMALSDHRVLLLGSARPGLPEQWRADLARLEHALTMPVERLGPGEVSDLLRDSFRSEQLVTTLAAKIIEKSDGNPFFVFEIIRGLREGQFITQSGDGSWVSTREIGEVQIPSSVLELINARVSDLASEERDLLEVAACCGFEFDPSLVADVVGRPLLPVLKQLASIERRHRLVRATGRKLVFDHHQLQEVLYESLYPQVREILHVRLAEALEKQVHAPHQDPQRLDGGMCVELSKHYLSGARGEKALRYLPRALDHLEAGFLNAQRLALGERALAVPGLVDGDMRARLLLQCMSSLRNLGRREQLLAFAEEAQELAERGSDAPLQASAARWLGTALYHNRRFDEVEPAHRRALELAIALGDLHKEALALSDLGAMFLERGQMEQALASGQRRLEIARKISHREIEAGALGSIGCAHWRAGRLEEARQYMEKQLEINRELGNKRGMSAAIGNLGAIHIELGQPDAALDCYETSLELDRECGVRTSQAIGMVNLGPSLQLKGDLESARRMLEAALALSRETGMAYPEGYALIGLGRLCVDEDDLPGARRYFVEAIEHRRRIDHADGVMDALIELVTVDLLTGCHDQARKLLEEARDLAERHGRPCDREMVGALFAALPGARSDEILEKLSGGKPLSIQPMLMFLVWKQSGDPSHLEAAKQLLDRVIDRSPEDWRQAMRMRLRASREILEAWRQQTRGGAAAQVGETVTETEGW